MFLNYFLKCFLHIINKIWSTLLNIHLSFLYKCKVTHTDITNPNFTINRLWTGGDWSEKRCGQLVDSITYGWLKKVPLPIKKGKGKENKIKLPL